LHSSCVEAYYQNDLNMAEEINMSLD